MLIGLSDGKSSGEGLAKNKKANKREMEKNNISRKANGSLGHEILSCLTCESSERFGLSHRRGRT